MNLFNRKTIWRAVAQAGSPDPGRQAAFRRWSESIASGRIAELKETELHGPFMQTIAIEALGYHGPVVQGAYSVTQEKSIIQGSVDLALGSFGGSGRRIVAPFELKGADTRNLDAIMPGRAKSPVDQAWEYATNNVGTRWVLVSNYLEIRLYSYGEGRQNYEVFDLSRLHEPDEFARAQLLLSAESLLGGRTAELLDESRRENRDITDRLYADYKSLRQALIAAVGQAVPTLSPLLAIRAGQTLLDRILFIAFAEDTALLPPRTLERAYEHSDPYNPQPVWRTFQALFRAIDTGNSQLNIPRYNGGLFAADPVIDVLLLSDDICEGFRQLAEYDFASEVSVTVLGHIFEQSIADVEQLQAVALGQAVESKKKTSGTSGRRKRDGVVYTPDYIARFIVDQTLGAHSRDIFAAVLREYAMKGATAADDLIRWRSKTAERKAWQAYRDRLTSLRIVDPACGSGVFLVMAFDWMKAEISRVNAKLAELSETGQLGDLLDPDSEILANNLFGVDVNEESVEIAKLSLWIKTARRGKVLDTLDSNFRVGDSLIEDANFAYRQHGFVWRDTFPEIFAEGGFDIVLGNPPYVRMELLKAMKPWLEKRYAVVADRANLYAYFFERGLKLLKPGGRMGYISSNTFFKTGSGAPLRNFLRQTATLETIVNFGEHQVFEGVTTYPAILIMRAEPPRPGHAFQFWNVDPLPPEAFEKHFIEAARPYPQARLQGGSWELEGETRQALRDKIKGSRPTLKEVFGAPLYGIKTGLNKAFVIDTATKERLCREDARSAELLKPFLEGKDLKRWRAEPRGQWIIYIPKNRVAINDYTAIRNWLEPFRESLEARATPQKWFELQQAQDSCEKHYEGRKIVYGEFSSENLFSIDEGHYINNKCYFIPHTDWWLLGYLNSRVFWFCVTGESVPVRGATYQMQSQFLEVAPIPATTDAQQEKLAALAQAAQAKSEQRRRLQRQVTRRITDLRPAGNDIPLSERLKAWWDLPTFAAFKAEIKKLFKVDIPLKERSEWEDWIAAGRADINFLSAQIAKIERDIDTVIYALFDLTPVEIAMLEGRSEVSATTAHSDGN